MMRIPNGRSCDTQEEKRIVAELMKEAESNLNEGNIYYVISAKWFTSWERYVSQESEFPVEKYSDPESINGVPQKVADRPGPINNSDLVLDENECKSDALQLRRMLEEGKDYVLVPQKVWENFHEWYKGGPALPRKMISQGLFSKSYVVEVYPLCLNLIDSKDNSLSFISLSRKASVRELYERVCALKGIGKEEACLWDYFDKRKQTKLDVSDQTLENSNLQMDQDILFEVQIRGHHSSRFDQDSSGNKLALVPLEPSRSSTTIAGGPTMSNGHSTGYSSSLYQGSTLGSSFTDIDGGSEVHSYSKKRERGGLTGLQNLGNTCFMNSSIQCLVHTPPIVEYFLKDYSDDINIDNPLGMRGELAVAFGELLQKLWSSGQTTIAPRVFKGKLARFAPQFSGYNQHDSQELLAFLLDGLHEDLNRVKKKPYIEAKDSDGRPDEAVAKESWNYHKARNDSIIVDICQGQYKSTLVCPVCGKVSITFDPFMYLTLPLPSTVTRTITVTVFYGNGRGLPMPYTVALPKYGCCKDLMQSLGSACCLTSDESLILAEVYDHRIYRYLEKPLEPLSSIKDDNYIVAYRVPKDKAGIKRLEILNRWQEKSAVSGERKLDGTPLVTYVDGDCLSEAEIDLAVSKILSPLKKTYSAKVYNDMVNGSISESIDDPMNSLIPNCCSVQTELEQSLSKSEQDRETAKELSCQISLTDEKGSYCKPIEKDSLIKSGQIVRVMLDWTAKDHDLYDISYLKDLPVVHKTGFTLKKTRQDAVSLYSCLEAYLTEEPLGPDDMWYCPRCKEHRQATKKLDLWRLPDILVFHLKRFSYSRYLKNKLDTFVNFPIQDLNLGRYVMNNDGHSHGYELYAISNHYGGLGGGHYTAYAKLIDENTWYHFDDSHVSPVSEAEIKTSAAYVLFYQRVKGEQRSQTGETSQGQIVS